MFTFIKNDPKPVALTVETLQNMFLDVSHSGQSERLFTPVILCIGTDRIIGDCLGPMVGTLLEKRLGESITPGFDELPVYGTLHRTVHALNLPAVSKEIKKKHPDRVVIAVDASLGSHERIGSVLIRPGSLQPGAGVSKSLPSTGDISITGIVAAESLHPYLDLQTVRLSVITDMAAQISDCIFRILCRIPELERV